MFKILKEFPVLSLGQRKIKGLQMKCKMNINEVLQTAVLISLEGKENVSAYLFIFLICIIIRLKTW